MNDALIGHSGFVGSTLMRQAQFRSVYRSNTIGDIGGRKFDRVCCAAAPAQKWLANKEPEVDRARIAELIKHLAEVTCRQFVLISTVDVFRNPAGCDESTAVEQEGLHAYGLHRRLLETFVADRFACHLIVRLPGLVGPGLRKNILFDLLNDNNISSIDTRSRFQFYPMVNLWSDLKVAIEAGIDLLHLTAEPISVAEVARLGFGRELRQEVVDRPACYDMQSRYAAEFGGTGRYQYSARESLMAIRAFAQTEPATATA